MKIFTQTKCDSLDAKNLDFKKNTILMGDSNHDIHMSKKMNSENVLNILFLKEDFHENIDKYLENGWDMVILTDKEIN